MDDENYEQRFIFKRILIVRCFIL